MPSRYEQFCTRLCQARSLEETREAFSAMREAIPLPEQDEYARAFCWQGRFWDPSLTRLVLESFPETAAYPLSQNRWLTAEVRLVLLGWLLERGDWEDHAPYVVVEHFAKQGQVPVGHPVRSRIRDEFLRNPRRQYLVSCALFLECVSLEEQQRALGRIPEEERIIRSRMLEYLCWKGTEEELKAHWPEVARSYPYVASTLLHTLPAERLSVLRTEDFLPLLSSPEERLRLLAIQKLALVAPAAGPEARRGRERGR